MLPAYSPGAHLVTFNRSKIRLGDVIVFARDEKKYLKRVDRVEGDLIYVSGDNRRESAKMQPVEKSQIIGKVILRY